MDSVPHYTTERLLLRQWQTSDRERFAWMNSDDRVMRYFPRHYTRAKSDAPSIRVMHKPGMVDHGERFEHPRIDPQSELCLHVVYR